MTAQIYSISGEFLARGLQVDSVCEEAVRIARRIAARRGEPVLLRDHDDWILVMPCGHHEMMEAE